MEMEPVEFRSRNLLFCWTDRSLLGYACGFPSIPAGVKRLLNYITIEDSRLRVFFHKMNKG
ncbi:hypothetical protein CHI02_00945 [Niallia circulans]|nr:hypothetical protein CHI02_00945 [Niallia circulans]